MELVTIGTPALWAGFTLLVLALLALDLGVFHREAHPVGFREALAWTGVWVGLAGAFNLWLASVHGTERGLEFLTGYLIEKALALEVERHVEHGEPTILGGRFARSMCEQEGG